MEHVRTALYYVFVLLEVILIFNLLIVVHELGHFLAARWRGLVVEQFAVWFGKPLWKRTYNGVVYSLGSIPFGGFVKLPQMAPMDAIEGSSDVDRATMPVAKPIDKIIVAFAGPLFSFSLAFVFAVIVWIVGRPVSEAETSTVVGYVVPDQAAAKAVADTAGVAPGLLPGDQILEVDGHPVTRFGGMNGSVVWYVARSEGDTIPFKVRRGDKVLTFYPKPAKPEGESSWRRKALRQVLIQPAFASIIDATKAGSPGALAGLHDGDVVTAVNGSKLYNPEGFSDLEQASYNRPVTLTVERDGKTFDLALPAMPFRIGNVIAGSPADAAGLEKDDTITTIEGAPATKFSDLKERVAAHPDQAISLGIDHKGVQRTVSITPLVPKGLKDAMIGIGPDFDADGIAWKDGGVTKIVKEPPGEQLIGSVSTIVNTVGAVLAPKSGIKLQHLGGPVFIGRTYFYLLTSPQGWRLALWFSVVLNVNLALLNMLPIPVLDGGHIMLALIESVRRKPVNIRWLEIVQTACFLLIAGYMLYVSFYDVGDLAGGRKSRREVEFPSPSPVQGK